MIREEFFPTNIYGKDIQIDNNKLAQDIINWSNKDPGLKKLMLTVGTLLQIWQIKLNIKH